MVHLPTLLSKASSLKICVIGDFCLDIYWHYSKQHCDVSVETLKEVKQVKQAQANLGSAGNLMKNLVDFGASDIQVIGMIGDDLYGREIQRQLQSLNIDTTGLIQQKEKWTSHVYVKPIADMQEENRFDLGNQNQIELESQKALLQQLEKINSQTDLLIINQQLTCGIFQQPFRQLLIKQLNTLQILSIVDSRDFSHEFCGSIRKLNEYEALQFFKLNNKPHDKYEKKEVLSAGFHLSSMYEKPVVITCGPLGVHAFEGQSEYFCPAVQPKGPIDTVGAGDSFLAGFSLIYALSKDLATACLCGNLCAGVTIQKCLTTGTAKPEELMALYQKVQDELTTTHQLHPLQTIEIISTAKMEKITHAIFDHDGTLSTLRTGWETIMKKMMYDIITQKKSVSEDLKEKIQNRIQQVIEETTGIRTLAQMEHLIHLIEEFQLIPPSQILDRYGYKKIYLDYLMKEVNQNTFNLRNGHCTNKDFMIKGALPFLVALKEKGIKLYLASGTDEKDVCDEAELMGYAHLFDGGIYGARDHYDGDIKELIMNEIAQEVSSFGHTVVFGDGPVEIKVGKSHDFITIGVASNEEKRYVLNLEKRKRLLNAGAHAIITDYQAPQDIFQFLQL